MLHQKHPESRTESPQSARTERRCHLVSPVTGPRSVPSRTHRPGSQMTRVSCLIISWVASGKPLSLSVLRKVGIPRGKWGYFRPCLFYREALGESCTRRVFLLWAMRRGQGHRRQEDWPGRSPALAEPPCAGQAAGSGLGQKRGTRAKRLQASATFTPWPRPPPCPRCQKAEPRVVIKDGKTGPRGERGAASLGGWSQSSS